MFLGNMFNTLDLITHNQPKFLIQVEPKHQNHASRRRASREVGSTVGCCALRVHTVAVD